MVKFQKSERVQHRDDLATLCNELKLDFRIVEIGVHTARYARAFLDRWGGFEYFGVDPWITDPTNTSDWAGPRDMHMMMAAVTLAPHWERVRLLQMTSVEATAIIPDVSASIVYIDGNHGYENVWADLVAWWPKVKVGGILAGHDYDPGHEGVMRAVDQWSAGLASSPETIWLTRDYVPSWFMFKDRPDYDDSPREAR